MSPETDDMKDVALKVLSEILPSTGAKSKVNVKGTFDITLEREQENKIVAMSFPQPEAKDANLNQE